PAETPPTPFGARLEQVRKGLHFESQAAFAEALSVSARRYNNWVRGVSNPSLDTLEKLRFVYHVDLNYLIAGDLGVLLGNPVGPPPPEPQAEPRRHRSA
ncbi:MAG: helix-turn-helix transcriptional regulator, partial [Burkholderiales bacterium]|nr:helix-turn-helix transcriptional regulator [Burkholderiales bacterium]